MTYEMEKEIRQQPEVLADMLQRYITADNKVNFELPEGIKKITLIASGSSYHCAEMIVELFKAYTNIKATCEFASEFYTSTNITVENDALYVFISQSGETTDTVTSLKNVKALGGKTLCVTNCKDSTMWNLCDYKIWSDAGEEKSIASTKALTAQILCLYLVMLELMEKQGKDISEQIRNIKDLPRVAQELLDNTEPFADVSKELTKLSHVALIGAKYFFPAAKEGALKIKETSYVDANAFPQGEFLHGHMAVLNNENSGLIAIVADATKENMKLILSKVLKDYKPTIITISNEDEILDNAINIKINSKDNINNLITAVIACQVLAFNTALALGRQVDTPVGLNKVVTL